MKKMSVLILVLIITLAITGYASAEVTIGAATSTSTSPQAGNSYTTGSIYCVSTPPGSSATLDGGEDQLFTPGTFSSVPPGVHNVMITMPGYQPTIKVVTVSVGTTQNVNVDLARVISPGSISLSTTPKGVGFYVDDIYQGKTNQIVGNLAAGPHKVGIYEAGYDTWENTVTVTSGAITPVTVTLVPEKSPDTGDLQVSSSPSGASVYLNNNYRGITPPDDSLDIVNLVPGSYTVSVKKSGYQDYATTVTIQAGKNVQMNAALQPASQSPTVASAQISSAPGGADVYVNGAYMGITPLSFQKVQPGTYTIEIRMDGYTPYTTTGQVIAGQNIQLSASLSPVPVATPTNKAAADPFVLLMALGIICLTGYLVSRR
ncbi:MAG: PEGA domain-containing protein [Methanomicrobiales archaeon]